MLLVIQNYETSFFLVLNTIINDIDFRTVTLSNEHNT